MSSADVSQSGQTDAEAPSGRRGFGRGLLQRGFRNVRAAGGKRLFATALALIFAVLLARYSWFVPGTLRDDNSGTETPAMGEAERFLFDWRSYINAPRVPQDNRIVVVVYTDQTLIALKKRSPLDRAMLARALASLDTMGAKSIGLDMLFDQPQDEDAELIAALRAMNTPTFVGYANAKTNAADIGFEQQSFLDQFMVELKGSNARPASIRLPDDEGETRLWPDNRPDLPPTLGRAMVGASDPSAVAPFADYVGPIRYRLPATQEAPVFLELPIDVVANPDVAAALAPQIAGRHVLVGGKIVDYDRVDTTLTPFLQAQAGKAEQGEIDPRPAGIFVHAEMIAQMLDGARFSKVAPWQHWAVAGLMVLLGALTSLVEARWWRVAPFFVVEMALIFGLPFLLQRWGVDTYGTPAVGWILGWLLGYIAVASAARASGAAERKFAHNALGKYLPADIAQEIIDNPERLTLSGSKRQLYILFSDLEGFTEMSHQLEPEMVAKLLNEYLDRLSAVVLEHGGVIDKYVGDAVVAFWGAPIARPDDAEKAAKAAVAMWQAGEDFRKSVDPSLPKIGKTRVGIHYGEAVVGNFGGERRIQYTALGDAMNTASRLESANKSLDSAVMASGEFIARAGAQGWRPMGRVKLRGRARPVDLYEPAGDFPEADIARLAEAMALSDTDNNGAVAIITELSGRHPDDAALANLLKRISSLGEGNAYVLG